MPPNFQLEPWLLAHLARVAVSRHAVALIGLGSLGMTSGKPAVEVSNDPADALARLRELPSDPDPSGDPRRPLRLAIWGAAAHDDRAASALLAWLRDVGADETWVLLNGQDRLWPARLLALGFTAAPLVGELEGQHCRRFCFAIRSYKPAPDWLGPHNWANPELFGQFRW